MGSGLVDAQGTDSNITALSTQAGSTSGVSYTLSFSGTDIVIAHSEAGFAVDVVAGFSGLRSVAP